MKDKKNKIIEHKLLSILEDNNNFQEILILESQEIEKQEQELLKDY